MFLPFSLGTDYIGQIDLFFWLRAYAVGVRSGRRAPRRGASVLEKYQSGGEIITLYKNKYVRIEFVFIAEVYSDLHTTKSRGPSLEP